MNAGGTNPKLREVIAAVPAGCYEKPTWLGLLYVGRALLLHAALCLALVVVDSPLLLAALWPLAGLAISGLFVLGHDAAHGALFRQRWLNDLVARLTLLPSLHASSPWILGHNRVHHVHTACEGADFVWHPLLPDAYAAMPRWRQWLHRLEWSAIGAGVYYVRAVWWEKMMRLEPPPRFVAAFRRDRALVWAYAAVWSLALFALGYTRTPSITAAFWMWLKVGLLPWLFWNHFIGTTVHIHHVGPGVLWRRRERWSRYRGQVEATTSFTVPRWYNLFAHNIHLHAAHHVDPRIPFYHLPRATAALQARFGTAFAQNPLRLRDHLASLRRCKLYDFEREVWMTYAEAQASSPNRSITPQKAA